jgi:hypothetical protein
MVMNECQFINCSESIGTTFNIILKGGSQIGAQTINATLDPSNQIALILAIGLVIAGFVFVLQRAANGRHIAREILQ